MSVETPKIVNCVFRGSLAKPINLREIHLNLDSNESVVVRDYRPHMLCVKRKGASLNLFPTGRFRIMGSQYKTSQSALQWFLRLTDKKLIPLEKDLLLQTQTVTLKTTPTCAKCIFDKYSDLVFFEPELFTAMKLLKWSDVHINLFFTGKTIILGRNALKRSSEVRHWFCQIEKQPVITTLTFIATSPSNFVKSYEKAVDVLLSFLPPNLHVLGEKYFKSYPPKLIFSWLDRIEKKGEKDLLIPQLCKRITSFIV